MFFWLLLLLVSIAILFFLFRERHAIPLALRMIPARIKLSRLLRRRATVWDLVLRNPAERTAMIVTTTGESVSYGALLARASVFARWAENRSETVALVSESSIPFVACWLGVSRTGRATALVNTHLRGVQLVHSLKASGATDVVVSSGELEGLVREVSGPLGLTVHVLEDILRSEANPVMYAGPQHQTKRGKDVAVYIYTSGTTGLPKPAVISHGRFLAAALGFGAAYAIRSSDRVYCTLPLYHTAGGVLGLGVCWGAGACMVLRPKFSASAFWAECGAHRCTVVQYIGELCRYLVSTPEGPSDRAHQVRLALGNGLRPDVWTAFQKRFCVPQIGEFYGASEGNCTLLNTANVHGAVGFVTPLMWRVLPVLLVKYNAEEGRLELDSRGRPIVCRRGEVGELIGKISNADPGRRFDGYLGDSSLSERKVLRDVLKQGDSWFRSGDLLRQDSDFFFYFVDRIGDTFRYKGENVSTSEVEVVIGGDVCVYGIEVQGVDGKMGMACIRLPDGTDGLNATLKDVARKVKENLAPYARPVYLRVTTQELPTTATFKNKRNELQKQGLEPGADLLFKWNGDEYDPC